jgi:DNA-binding CsgD family transcriptional regulator
VLPAAGAPLTPPERVALAHATPLDSLRGLANADLRARVRQAWGDGTLLDAPGSWAHTLPALLIALLIADELDLFDEIIGAPRADGEPLTAGRGLRPLRAWSLYLRGRITEAEAEARASAELDELRWPAQQAVALAVIACCQIYRGSLAPAEAAVAELGELAAVHPAAAPLHQLARCELRLAQHRPDDALTDASAVAVIVDGVIPQANAVALAWRPAAASAHLALGQADATVALLETELADARRLGNARATIRALRLLGLAVGDEAGLDYLAEAVEVGEATTGRLEHLRALIDHGAALRRANQRVAARAPLSYALHLSHHAGASVLADRARTELIAAGARPRRVALSGIDSLTASQRRVAELAARGLTTRQVAEALFVTPKTVEFHLRQTYRKLDVASRDELAELFGA